MKINREKDGKLYRHLDMSEIQERNHRAGYHFFDEDTTRFFRSKYGSHVFPGNYFVTGDARGFRDSDGRGYTIRKAWASTGDVDTVGEFNQYATRRQAERAAEKLSKAEPVVPLFEFEKQEREHATRRLAESISWQERELIEAKALLAELQNGNGGPA